MSTDSGDVEFDGLLRPSSADGVREGLQASVRRCDLSMAKAMEHDPLHVRWVLDMIWVC